MKALPVADYPVATIALVAGMLIGPQTYAQSVCSGKLAGLMPYAGTYRSRQLLDEPKVSSALSQLLGAEVAHLKNNLNVTGPVDLISCNLVISGNAPHRGGEEEAIVAISLYSARVTAAISSKGHINIYADTGKTLPGMAYEEAVPLAIKDWLAVIYTRDYFRFHPPANARLLQPQDETTSTGKSIASQMRTE